MAQKLGWSLLDSGAIYRAFALAVDARGVDIGDVDALEVMTHYFCSSLTPLNSDTRILPLIIFDLR
jgi:cytidylate kinase